MKVLKFGGTSVGSVERMAHVAELALAAKPCVLVLSAMSGTTNTLVDIAEHLYNGDEAGAAAKIAALETKYRATATELIADPTAHADALLAIDSMFCALRCHRTSSFGEADEKKILAAGELLTTAIMDRYFAGRGVRCKMLPALDFMRTRPDGEPDMKYIADRLHGMIAAAGAADIYLTQGYICRNASGAVDNLRRGGSDYTATIVGAAIGADEVQIWTDIDGMHNNDPRYVDGTSPVPSLTYDEAIDLAYFGAKILHPSCVIPARDHDIPVRLLNTMEPTAVGTMISSEAESRTVAAIAARDGVSIVTVRSGRTVPAWRFAADVLAVLAGNGKAPDMICSCGDTISIATGDGSCLDGAVAALERRGSVDVEPDMAIVCVSGDMGGRTAAVQAEVLTALADTDVRMTATTAGGHSILVAIGAADRTKALRALSAHLFTNTLSGKRQ